MKYLYIILFFLFYTISNIGAQSFRVTYSEEPNIEAQIQEVEDLQEKVNIRAQLEKMTRLTYLYYNNKESLYSKSSLSASVDENSSNDQIIVMDNNYLFYKNHKNQQGIAQETIFENFFLIDEVLNETEWTLSNESAMIAGYDCKKAINKDGNIAWYTMDIPINDGPERYWGLPGLILKIETPYMSITVKEINPDFDTENIIKQPTTGKKISRKEFDVLFAKKIEEMQLSFENGDY